MTHVIGPVFHGESNGTIFASVMTMQICIICKNMQNCLFSAHFCTFHHENVTFDVGKSEHCVPTLSESSYQSLFLCIMH